MPKYGWYFLILVVALLTFLILKRKKSGLNGLTQINMDDYMQTVFGKPRS